MSPFALLVDIARRSRTNASELPQQIEAVSYWRGVGFMLAGQQFVTDMGQVAEILQPPRLTKVPGVKSWVLGVANVRGRLVPVMDLAGLLGLSSRVNWRSRRVLVIEQGDVLTGLLVDAVLGMQQFPVDTMRSVSEVEDSLADFVHYGFEKNEKVWSIFRIDELVQSSDFLQIAV
ncbi:chemotaxis protein CheW [Oceanobacter mangrovi]|uniref:chemotaxis protein CheW n=1 Tax=Oceanobacter mangrovi TaxID=2862510 RepID=UPI001C8D59E2|nr:chemotaxis protein CheW [Oceanobacter mangrovi]